MVKTKLVKRLICKLFGCDNIHEVYCKKVPDEGFAVVGQMKCGRCGAITKRSVTPPTSRAELLKRGWFIEEEE